MKNIVKITLLAGLSGILLGCSTIMTGGYTKVKVNSQPPNTDIMITDEKGVVAFQGETPVEVKLKSGKAYFRGKSYTIEFKKEGYRTATTTLKSNMSGRYIGNLLFGGLPGLLIVDPLTGAVYTLPKDAAIDLTPLQPKMSDLKEGDGTGLRIVSVVDYPAEFHHHMVKVN